jgi:uncharacterized tellurite resistance protein B-like protein
MVANGFLAAIRSIIDGDPGVRRVADDPALIAELLLLFRMALADGEVRERELEVLKRIAAQSFGIEGESFAAVVKHLRDFGYETNAGQSIAVFQELDLERRRALARRMAAIAKADDELSAHEVRLLARVVELLGLSPSDVTEPGQPTLN